MAQHHPPRSHAIHSRVRSFSRAGGRLRPVQAEALAQLGPRYVVDVPRADAVRTVSAGAVLVLLGPTQPCSILLVPAGCATCPAWRRWECPRRGLR